jgi:hypothetical protein
MPTRSVCRLTDADLLLHLETLQHEAGVYAYWHRELTAEYCTTHLPFDAGWEFYRHPVYDQVLLEAARRKLTIPKACLHDLVFLR